MASMASTTSAHNPFVDPIRLPSATGRIHARKPSRSPVRRDVREADSLLRDLSPTSTLRAFLTDPSDMGSSADFLVTSIRSATLSERGLGAKAAQACLDLRTWTREIEHWQWPGTFEPPEHARNRVQLETSHVLHSTNGNGIEGNEEYWGSLPARLVQEYERRADEIGQGLDDIDVEELKDYVLNSHYRINSRPPSRANVASEYISTVTELKELDDFTALVTATILQALPFLSRLNHLLDIWTIRLIVLRGAPRFLYDLERARTDLDNCWAAITAPPNDALAIENGRALTVATMSSMKASIEDQLGSLGRRMDRFLDALEGRNECVPDSWIDDFESCESDYSTWVVQAEKTAVDRGCERQLQMPTISVSSAAAPRSTLSRHNGLLPVSEREDPVSDDDAVRRPSQSFRSSVDEAQLAMFPSITGSAAPRHDEVARLSSDEPWMNTNRVVSAPLSMISHVPRDPMAEHDNEGKIDAAVSGVERSASMSSRSKIETTGSVAAKRAAFLRDIERNQSLNKSTLSPVRPFERASNAFTRLFKKEKSPEQVTPKRTATKFAEGRTASAERNALSPVSFASPKFNSTVSTQSAASDATSSVDDLNETQRSGSSSRDRNVHNDRASHADDYHAQETPLEFSAAEESVSLIRGSSGSLSSPFHSPAKEDFSEQPPLPPSVGMQSSAPFGEMNSHDDELKTPSTPMDTDVFDRTFVASFPRSDHRNHKAARASPGTRRASLPLSQRVSSGDVPLLPSVAAWAPTARAERRGSASLVRPKTAPSENATMPRYAKPRLLQAAGSWHLRIPDDTETSDVDTTRTSRVKRASVASIEAFSRSELKSIDVPRSSRRSSVSSRRSPPPTPSGVQKQKRASLDNGSIARNSTHTLARRYSLPSPAIPLPELNTPKIFRSSPVLEHSPGPLDTSSAPLNIVMKKLRSSQMTNRREDTTPATSSSIQDSSPGIVAMHADQFDRHVSEVLQGLPAPIRFKARAGAETPVSRARGFSGSRPKISNIRVPPKGGDMTIAPAEYSPKRSRVAADSEVKLYHLTHTGREDPIKLFVRLVGEGERVMVRVGGGWADLADYLRDFASHHGSRTVSEGNLEVAALPTAPLSARKFSNPAEYQRAKTPTTPREVRPVSSDDDDVPLKRPPLDSRVSAVATPTTAGITASSTPKSSKSGSSNSRPSTACNSRPSSRQAQIQTAAEVGLSGPSSASKRAQLPAEKARWVEGMISRAKKSASAEKSKEEKEKHFNEMGKAGSTRRVIFRSGSGAGVLQDKTNK